MRGWIWVVLCASACSHGDEPAKAPPAPPPAPAGDAAIVAVALADAPPPAPALKLVGCTPAELPPRLATPSNYGTIGHGSPYGVGFGRGLGDLGGGGLGAPGGIGGIGGMAPRESDAPPFALGPVNVTGALDKEIIRRFLKRNVSKFRYCFEKVLVVRPNLEEGGVVSVAFTVLPNGVVTGARAAGLDNEVDSCAIAVLNSIELPKPSDGNVVQVQTKLTYGPPPRSSRGSIGNNEPPVRIADTTAWTPYAASGNLAPAAASTKAVSALATTIAAQLDKPAACWGDRTGSLRAMLRLDKTGTVKSVRAGGLGDRDSEACVEAALAGLKVDAPAAEVACDFERGAPASWRVSLSGGYTVLDVVGAEVRKDGQPIKKLVGVDRAKTTFVIVGDLHANAGSLAPAFALAGESAANIIAVRSDAGAPLWVAMARDGRAYDGDGDAPRPVIDTRGTLRACVGGKPFASLAALTASCGTSPCATQTLGVDRGAELAAAVDGSVAARAAGFDRLLFSFDATCPKP